MTKKVKEVIPVTYEEAYKHLRLDFGDDDELVNRLVKTATQLAENYIEKSIAQTLSTLKLNDFYGDTVKIDEGNFIEVVSIKNSDDEEIHNHSVKVYANYFIINLKDSIKTDTLTIVYKIGYEENECPEDIKAAILIKVGELYDIDRSGYLLNNYKATGAFEAILNYHKPIRFS